MGLNATSKNLMLNALAAVAVYVTAHDGAPGANGANEIAGQVREAIAWEAAAAGVLAADVTPSGPVLDIGAGGSVEYLGLWSQLATGGTFYGFADVDDEVFTNAGTYTITGFTITASDPA
jgi:hypothetical protein